MCHGANVAEVLYKKKSHAKSGAVEKYKSQVHCWPKIKYEKLVFFADDAWFTLDRNVEGKSYR
jgi:hypothetical protein